MFQTLRTELPAEEEAREKEVYVPIRQRDGGPAKIQTEKGDATKQLRERADHMHLLQDTAQHIDYLFWSIGPLFDPVEAAKPEAESTERGSDSTSTERGSESDTAMDGPRERMLARMQEFHRVLEPTHEKCVMIHTWRRRAAELARSILEFLFERKAAYLDACKALFKVLHGMAINVGYYRSPIPLMDTEKALFALDWPFTVLGAAPRLPPATRFLNMISFDKSLQMYATKMRVPGDIERQILRSTVQGCTSPYKDVAAIARNILVSLLTTMPGLAQDFLQSMNMELAKLILDFKNEDENSPERRTLGRRIARTLETLAYQEGSLSVPRTCKRYYTNDAHCLELLLEAISLDDPEITEHAVRALNLMRTTDRLELMGLLDNNLTDAIWPSADMLAAISRELEKSELLRDKAKKDMRDRAAMAMATKRQRASIVLLVTGVLLSLERSESPPAEFVTYLTQGALDPEPREVIAFMKSLTFLIHTALARADFGHNPAKYLRCRGVPEWRMATVVPKGDNKKWTEAYLASFHSYDDGGAFFDNAGIGSLVWGTVQAASADPIPPTAGEDPEATQTLQRVGAGLNLDWYREQLAALLREEGPSEEVEIKKGATIQLDWVRLRVLMATFVLMSRDKTAASLEDIENLVKTEFGDGKKIGQHAAAAHFLTALVSAEASRDFCTQAQKFAVPMIIDALGDKLIATVRNMWLTCVQWLLVVHDPRRYPGLARHFSELLLSPTYDVHRNETTLLIVSEFFESQGWRLRSGEDVVATALAHVGGSLAGIEPNQLLGRLIAHVYNSSFHESFPSGEDFRDAAVAASLAVGHRPYEPGEKMRKAVRALFAKVTELRLQHEGEEKEEKEEKSLRPISHDYMHAARTALAWLHTTLSSAAAVVLVSLLSDFLDEVFHLLDVSHADAQDLRSSAEEALMALTGLPFDVYGKSDWILHGLYAKAEADKKNDDEKKEEQQVKTVRSRKIAMRMVGMYHRQRLLVASPQEQTAILQKVFLWAHDEKVELRIVASEILQYLLCRSSTRTTVPFLNSTIATIKAKKPSNAQDLARCDWHGDVLSLRAALLAFPQEVFPPAWMVSVVELLCQMGSRSPHTHANKDALDAVAAFKTYRYLRWDAVEKVSKQNHHLEGSYLGLGVPTHPSIQTSWHPIPIPPLSDLLRQFLGNQIFQDSLQVESWRSYYS